MVREEVPSRCSGQKPLQFRWYGFIETPEGLDLDTLMSVFVQMIEAPGRVQDNYVTSMAKAEFKHKILLAMKGALYPITEVGAVGWNQSFPLYEIRWQTIKVQERQPNGNFRTVRLLVRMYHSEPALAPHYFIGHHLHEKIVSDSRIVNRLQNNEISLAISLYKRGLSTFWGISGLT